MNIRANGAPNFRRNEQFLSLLQHKTRVRHLWTSKSEKLTWNILLYVGKPLFCIDSSLRFYFLSGYGVMSSTTRDNKRDYNVGALRNSFLTKESFWCFYIAFKNIKYTSKLDSFVLTTILSFLCQCPHDKPLQLCHHQKPFLPYNHFTHSTMANYFDHATHDKPFKIFHPWKPWVLFHQDKPFHPCHSSQTISPILSTTYHLSETKKVFHPPYVSLQRRDISRSLLFWQWLGSCRYRFFSPSLLIFLWITQHCI